jgi:hypothetical protein
MACEERTRKAFASNENAGKKESNKERRKA